MKQLLIALVDAWKSRAQLGDSKHHREMAQFLPAALEIQHSPPHPLARWLNWSLIGLFSLGIVWACFGKVDIVATAEGKIIPSSRVKQIQPLEKSVIKNILVQEGQFVEQGQPLVELDNTFTLVSESQLLAEQKSLQNQLLVDQLLLGLTALPLAQQAEVTPSQVRQILITKAPKSLAEEHEPVSEWAWQQWQDYWSQYLTLKSSYNKLEAELKATQAQISKWVQTLPLLTDRLGKVEQLYNKQYVTQADYLDLKQQHIEHSHNLESERQRHAQLQAQRQEVLERIRNLNAQAQAHRLTQINEAQLKLESLNGELTKAHELNAKKVLYSPVAGRVQDLAISTVGGVVTDAQQLMLIVPEQDRLQAEVYLSNQDIGFVEDGMNAEIKVHTFPFTKYGLVHAQVISVSKDAIVDEQQGLIYRMQLELKDNNLKAADKPIELKPGMAVTAELQTGQRRIIEFFLSPLLKAGSEGLRER